MLSEGFREWLGYYKEIDMIGFYELSTEERKRLLNCYVSHIDMGWIDVKDDLIKMKKK